MKIQPDDVYALATAARLAITPEEAHAVFEKLQGISQMIEAMRCVDTSGIEPMTHVALHPQPLREDIAIPEFDRTHWQQSAPLTHEGFYMVPQVID